MCNEFLMKNSSQGTISKSFKNSFFVRCNIRSNLAEKLLNDTPSYDNIKVVVLQIMHTNDNWLLVELISKDDFSEICGGKKCVEESYK